MFFRLFVVDLVLCRDPNPTTFETALFCCAVGRSSSTTDAKILQDIISVLVASVLLLESFLGTGRAQSSLKDEKDVNFCDPLRNR